VTNEIVAVTNGILAATQVIPVHDWTIQIGNGRYGLEEWSGSNCLIRYGSGATGVNLPAPVVASGLLLIVLILLLAGWHLIGKLRDRDAPRDA